VIPTPIGRERPENFDSKEENEEIKNPKSDCTLITFISNDERTSKAEAAVALEKQNLAELRFRDYHISIIVHSYSIPSNQK
jgi:hypothetical protein